MPLSVMMYSAMPYGWSGEKSTSNNRTPTELDAESLTVRSDFLNKIRVVTKFDQTKPKQGTEQLGLFSEIAAVTWNKPLNWISIFPLTPLILGISSQWLRKKKTHTWLTQSTAHSCRSDSVCSDSTTFRISSARVIAFVSSRKMPAIESIIITPIERVSISVGRRFSMHSINCFYLESRFVGKWSYIVNGKWSSVLIAKDDVNPTTSLSCSMKMLSIQLVMP